MELLDPIYALAREAGEIIQTYAGRKHGIMHKSDASPVTDADIAADRHIKAGLKKLAPPIPIVSEEDSPLAEGPPGEVYFLLDPLDGTRSFVRGHGSYTVNIGLITGTKPVMGVIVDPQEKCGYIGAAHHGAWRLKADGIKEKIHMRDVPREGLSVFVSHAQKSPKSEEFLSQFSVHEKIAIASSIKFCRLAEGMGDMYVRCGPTSEWDTAAGQAIAEAAGGIMTTLSGAPFTYGKPGWRNGPFVVAKNPLVFNGPRAGVG